jgi:hypothetical protein
MSKLAKILDKWDGKSWAHSEKNWANK